MKVALMIASVGALLGCLVSAVMVFAGSMDEQAFKAVFLGCSLAWFILSALRIYRPTA